MSGQTYATFMVGDLIVHRTDSRDQGVIRQKAMTLACLYAPRELCITYADEGGHDGPVDYEGREEGAQA